MTHDELIKKYKEGTEDWQVWLDINNPTEVEKTLVAWILHHRNEIVDLREDVHRLHKELREAQNKLK